MKWCLDFSSISMEESYQHFPSTQCRPLTTTNSSQTEFQWQLPMRKYIKSCILMFKGRKALKKVRRKLFFFFDFCRLNEYNASRRFNYYRQVNVIGRWDPDRNAQRISSVNHRADTIILYKLVKDWGHRLLGYASM